MKLRNILTLLQQLKRNGILSQFDWRQYGLRMRIKVVKYVKMNRLKNFASLKLTEPWVVLEKS